MSMSRSKNGRLTWEEVQAWKEAVDGAKLLDELREVFRRYVVLPKWGAEMLALWTVHTYAWQLREVTTYVGVSSPEKRCGKTTLLGVLIDRKSTRLNSSHSQISYAVFCLKKK